MHSLFDNFFIQFFYNFEAVGRPTNRGAELLLLRVFQRIWLSQIVKIYNSWLNCRKAVIFYNILYLPVTAVFAQFTKNVTAKISIFAIFVLV